MRRIVYSGLASAVVGLLPRTKMNKADSARQSEMGGKLIPSSHYRWSKMFCPGDGPAGGYRTVRRGTLDLFWLKSEFHFLDPLDLLCYIWIWDIRIFLQSGWNGLLIYAVSFGTNVNWRKTMKSIATDVWMMCLPSHLALERFAPCTPALFGWSWFRACLTLLQCPFLGHTARIMVDLWFYDDLCCDFCW